MTTKLDYMAMSIPRLELLYKEKLLQLEGKIDGKKLEPVLEHLSAINQTLDYHILHRKSRSKQDTLDKTYYKIKDGD